MNVQTSMGNLSMCGRPQQNEILKLNTFLMANERILETKIQLLR